MQNLHCFQTEICNTTHYLRTENTRAIFPMARILFRMTSFRMAPLSVDDQEEDIKYNITLKRNPWPPITFLRQKITKQSIQKFLITFILKAQALIRKLGLWVSFRTYNRLCSRQYPQAILYIFNRGLTWIYFIHTSIPWGLGY